MKISFEFKFQQDDEEGVYFSFCFPWSYSKNEKFLDYIQNKFCDKNKVYFHREILTYSKENRKVHLLTISSQDKITSDREPVWKNIFPEKKTSFVFARDKPIIFLTARVHPAETSSSFMLCGLLKFLASEDRRAQILLKFFVFKIVPIINVDGVSRGFYRHDTNGLNMNRHYADPDPSLQPEIFAIKKVFLHLSNGKRVRYYFDLHGYVRSRGLFLFGNSLEFIDQVENKLLPKIIEMNSEYLKFDNCDFNENNKKAKDKLDKFTKQGTGRVFFNKTTALTHCYTVEASSFRGSTLNQIPNKEFFFEEKIIEGSSISPKNLYDPQVYFKMGISIIVSVLDYEELNPFSRIFETVYKNVSNLRKVMAMEIVKNDKKYKYDIKNLNYAKNIVDLKRFVPLSEKSLKQPKKRSTHKSHSIVESKRNFSLINNKEHASNCEKQDIRGVQTNFREKLFLARNNIMKSKEKMNKINRVKLPMIKMSNKK